MNVKWKVCQRTLDIKCHGDILKKDLMTLCSPFKILIPKAADEHNSFVIYGLTWEEQKRTISDKANSNEKFK